jgi:hypothetical protein
MISCVWLGWFCWVYLGLLDLVWFVACNRWKHVGIVLVLATRIRLVNLDQFLATGVRPMSL